MVRSCTVAGAPMAQRAAGQSNAPEMGLFPAELRAAQRPTLERLRDDGYGTSMDLLQDAYYNGERRLGRSTVAQDPRLFRSSAALFLTPTSEIPPQHVGSGALTVRLPIPTPSWIEMLLIPGYRSPRLWVDQLQRATGRIRWTPMTPALVTVTHFDVHRTRDDETIVGTKALIDALKARSTGRADGQYVYYFGAIVDDGCDFIKVKHDVVIVDTPVQAGVEITVRPAGASMEHVEPA